MGGDGFGRRVHKEKERVSQCLLNGVMCLCHAHLKYTLDIEVVMLVVGCFRPKQEKEERKIHSSSLYIHMHVDVNVCMWVIMLLCIHDHMFLLYVYRNI